MNVETLGSMLDLRSPKVIRKAKEFDRLLSSKVPSGFGMKVG